LRKHLDKFVIVYLDDILIYSDTFEEHVEHVSKVLELFEAHDLYVKGEKYTFHTTKVEFLGYEVSTKGIYMDSSKIQALKEWLPPSDIPSLQSFLSFTNYYQRFILSFSKLTQPLTSLLQKDTPWKWSEACQLAFDLLKKAFTSAPILRHFDPALPITIETDASDFSYGTVLSQKDSKGLFRPVAFYLKKMS